MPPTTTHRSIWRRVLLGHRLWGLALVGAQCVACGNEADEGAGTANEAPAAPSPGASDDSNTPGTVPEATVAEFPVPAPGEPGAPDDALIVEGEDDGTEPSPAMGTECARDTYEGERGDVNLYLLLDVSGSMLAPVSADDAAVTQWDAVRSAVTSFIEAPTAEGFNLALNYYPIQGERADCNAFGTCAANVDCVIGLCDVSLVFSEVRPCTDSSQCLYVLDLGDGELYEEQCVQPGRCDNDPFVQCILDEHCGDGVCLQHDRGLCPGETSCEPAAYVEPSVDRAGLPEAGADLVESLLLREPDPYGITPTHVALAGAYTRVDEWRQVDPATRSVVVLATDGEPVGCAAGQTAEEARDEATNLTYRVVEAGAGAGIQTFVIGVTPDLSALPEADRAEIEPYFQSLRDKLNQMATRGGTSASYNVSANAEATSAFLEALEAIRGEVLPCDYAIPTPDSGALAFDRLNVEVTTTGEPLVAPKVTDQAACVANELGWYYDVDEASQSPSRVVLCPSTCEQVNAVEGGRIDIVLGCQTVVRVR